MKSERTLKNRELVTVKLEVQTTASCVELILIKPHSNMAAILSLVQV